MDQQLSTKTEKFFESLSQNRFWFQAEWHFYATSHGKGPCDGIGGTVTNIWLLRQVYKEHIILKS